MNTISTIIETLNMANIHFWMLAQVATFIAVIGITWAVKSFQWKQRDKYALGGFYPAGTFDPETGEVDETEKVIVTSKEIKELLEAEDNSNLYDSLCEFYKKRHEAAIAAGVYPRELPDNMNWKDHKKIYEFFQEYGTL